MDKIEFEKLVSKIKNKNSKIFGLDSDCKPMIKEIKLVEKYYNVVFPKSYKEFLIQYGGGYFAFIIVYSLDEQSPFYIKNNVSIEFVNNNNFFPIIDFATGDLAGFKVDNGICEDSIVFYSHEDNNISNSKLNFYDVLAKYGLKLN